MLQIQLKFYHYSGSSNLESQFQVLTFQVQVQVLKLRVQVQVLKKPDSIESDSSPSPGLESYNSGVWVKLPDLNKRW